MAEGNSEETTKLERRREQEGNSPQHGQIKTEKEQKIKAQPWLSQKHQEAEKGRSEECGMN